MQLHGSCAARQGAAVLVTGPPGSGKSDLVLRLLDRSFVLVADDRVEIEAGHASPPPALAGLLEVRGLGILRLPYEAGVRVELVVELGSDEMRMPAMAARHAVLDVPVLRLDPARASAPERVGRALDCATGRTTQIVGAFAAGPDETGAT